MKNKISAKKLPKEYSRVLTQCFVLPSPNSVRNFRGISRDIVINSQWDCSTIHFDENGHVTIPNGVIHFDSQQEKNIQRSDRENKIIAQCLEYMRPLFEYVLGVDMRNSTHFIKVGVMVYYPKFGQEPWSGPWHQDAFRDIHYRATGLAYFAHDHVSAKLSLAKNIPHSFNYYLERAKAPRPPSPVHALKTLQTTSGDSVVFDNRALQHRVHDVVALSNKNATRGLLTFMYDRPREDIPRPVMPSMWHGNITLIHKDEHETKDMPKTNHTP